MSEETGQGSGFNRSEFLKRGGVVVGGALVGSSLGAVPSWARANTPLAEAHDAAVGTINIGYVSPITGADAGFGEPDPYVIGLARKAFANGLKIHGKTWKVNIIQKDAQSTPAVSAKVTQGLINTSKVDLLLATSTPEVVVPAVTARRGCRSPRGLHHGSVAGMVAGGREQPDQAEAVQMDLPLQLRSRQFLRHLHQPLAAGGDQQEGRGHVPQRRRRKRDP